MNVAFVYPPQEVFRFLFTDRIYRQYSREGAILPPLGIAYLASLIEREHAVCIIDANALRLSVGAVVARLQAFRPDVLLFSLVTTSFMQSIRWIEAIKKHIQVPVIVGGPHVSIYPRETLAYTAIDYGVIGDAWETLPELLRAIAAGKGCGQVKGIALRVNGAVTMTEERRTGMTIEDVPFPARHLLPNERYRTIVTKRRPVTAMMSSSGCPFECIYCQHSRAVVLRSPASIVDEMEECQEKYGIREVMFYDEIFSLDRSRVMELCREIIRRRLTLAWSMRTRCDCVDQELIRLFVKAGCIRINFGIESANPAVLRMLKRDMPLERIVNAVRWAREERLDVFGFFMIGFPGESVQSIEKTIALASQLGLDFVQIAKVIPLPGTELYEMVRQKGNGDPWRDYVRGRSGLPQFAPIDSELGIDDLNRAMQRAYRDFYFRPRYMFRRLSRVASFAELRSLCSSAFSLR